MQGEIEPRNLPLQWKDIVRPVHALSSQRCRRNHTSRWTRCTVTGSGVWPFPSPEAVSLLLHCKIPVTCGHTRPLRSRVHTVRGLHLQKGQPKVAVKRLGARAVQKQIVRPTPVRSTPVRHHRPSSTFPFTFSNAVISLSRKLFSAHSFSTSHRAITQSNFFNLCCFFLKGFFWRKNFFFTTSCWPN